MTKAESKSVGVDQEVAATPLINSKNHEPGFKLDALVDERVFGHTVAWRNSFSWRTDIIDEIKANSRGFDLITEAQIAGACVPQYSARIADAWLVIQKLAECNERVEVMAERRGFRHRCRIWSDGYNCREETAIGAPLAICRAALRALDA